jgi:hypothetical protein
VASRCCREGVITIDILVLVDRLEELFHKGASVPFSRRKIVDEQAFLDIIDQMRIAVPDDVRQARRIIEERDRLVANAQDDAERIRGEAQQHAAILMSQQGITQASQEQADEIEAAALAHRAQLMAEADQHCLSVLSALEDELNKLLASTRSGITNLQGLAAAPGKSEMESSEK